MYNELDTENTSLFEAQYEQNTQPEAPAAPQQEAVKSEPDERTKNLRLLRERAERAEQRAEELERFLKTQSQQQTIQHQAQSDDDDDLNIEDDSYAEGKHLKKVYKKTAQELRDIKRMLQERDQQNALTTAETRLKAEFPDITEVVTQENLKDLAAVRPDLYETIMYNPDIYKRGKIAREMIKNYVLEDRYSHEDKRLQENKNKPRSAATVSAQNASESPLSRIGDYDRRILSEERKNQLRKQVALAKQYR